MRLGQTAIYHEYVIRKGLFGKLYILIFGTPHVGTFANGIYLKRILRKRTFKNILDAGCGSGTFSFYIAKNFSKSSVVGVDIGKQGLHDHSRTLDVCSKIQKTLKLPNLVFTELDLCRLSAKGEYDLIICFDVLEHIKENQKVIKNFFSALKKGGWLLLRIPTKEQVRLFDKKYTRKHELWAKVEHVGQHHDMKSLVYAIEEVGFKIVFKRYTNGVWGRLSFELNEIMEYYNFPLILQYSVVPFLKLLRYIDTLADNKEGNGLLVLCEKNNNV